MKLFYPKVFKGALCVTDFSMRKTARINCTFMQCFERVWYFYAEKILCKNTRDISNARNFRVFKEFLFLYVYNVFVFTPYLKS